MEEKEPIKTSVWEKVFTPKKALITLIIILVLWGVNLCVALNSNNNSANLWGDAFGMVNSLFSGLAFCGLFYSIMLQRKELKDTRDEFKTQNQTLKLQQFENTFFNMLKMLEDNINSINGEFLQPHDNVYKNFHGLEFYHEFLVNLDLKIIEELNKAELINGEDINFRELINTEYNKIYFKFEHKLSKNFRILNHFILHIKNSKIVNHNFYYNLLSAHFGDSFRTILFYNCISSVSNNKFNEPFLRIILDEIDFFENLDINYIDGRIDPYIFYPNTNFKFFPKKEAEE